LHYHETTMTFTRVTSYVKCIDTKENYYNCKKGTIHKNSGSYS